MIHHYRKYTSTPRVFAAAAAIGFVAGLRSLTAPAIVSWFAKSGDLRLRHTGLRFLASSASANTFVVLAAGELIADKLPHTPSRTDPAPLAIRIAMGALCGAAICVAKKERGIEGALLGGMAAVGGSFAGYQFRKRIAACGCVPDLPVALVEDGIAIGGGTAAMRLLY